MPWVYTKLIFEKTIYGLPGKYGYNKKGDEEARETKYHLITRGLDV